MTNLIQTSDLDNKEKKHTAFLWKMIMFLGLIFARNILEVHVPVTLLLVASVLIILTSDRDEIIILAICCLPLSTAFQYKYTIMVCVIVYYFKFIRDIKFSAPILLLLAMMTWELLHAYGDDNFTFNEFYRSFAELIFCVFLVINTHKKIDYPTLCRVLAICTCVMCVIVLIKILEAADYDFEKIFEGTYRFGISDSEAGNFGTNYNANGLGYMCNIAVCGLLQLTFCGWSKKIDYLLMIALLIFGFLTMSRTFLLCLVFVALMYISFRVNSLSKLISSLIITALISLVVYYVIATYMPFIFESITDRLNEKDITGGRAFLFEFYNEHIMSKHLYLLFGLGLQNLTYKLYNIYGLSGLNVPHNGIQELIVVWGLPGLAMFIGLIHVLLKSSKHSYKRRLVNYMPLILMFLYVQTGQLITSGVVLLSLAFCYMSLNVNFNKT